MITIVNVGPHDGNLLGESSYELRINGELIADFQHRRAEGLGRCLLAAAAAVEKRRWEAAGRPDREWGGAAGIFPAAGLPTHPPLYVELMGIIERACRLSLIPYTESTPRKPTPQQLLRAKLEKQWSREETKEEAAREREAARRAARERKARIAEAKKEEAEQRKELAEKAKAEKRARKTEADLLANAMRNRLKTGKTPTKPKAARDASMRRVIRHDKAKVLKDGQVFRGSEGRGG